MVQELPTEARPEARPHGTQVAQDASRVNDATNKPQGNGGDALDSTRQSTSDPQAMKDLRSSESARNIPTASCLPTCDVSGWTQKNDNFNKVDTDHDGFLSKDELLKAAKNSQFSKEDKDTLNYMAALVNTIQKTNNDEWGFESRGISRKDAEKFVPFQPDLKTAPWRDLFDKNEFNVWTGIVGDKLGLKENEQVKEQNAFRHAFTSAVYSMKYGESIALGLGGTNEIATGIRDRFKEKDDYWKYDSQADSYNNRVGIAIARELQEEAKKTGKEPSIDDVVARVYKKLKEGQLIVDPRTGKNSRGEVLQRPDVD